MNRNTFLKSVLALCGLGAMTATATDTETPKITITDNKSITVNNSSTGTLSLNELQITDNKHTYRLIVKDGSLCIDRINDKPEITAESNSNLTITSKIIKPKSVIFDLQ